ncbi:MAG: sigma-54-dependent Fis family transcriptional regulator [Deltaproteobacteria bacterium]|nr:sigma-54-dependent Fis family transcriptional regulator [Deltaproteobacteria bacterium]
MYELVRGKTKYIISKSDSIEVDGWDPKASEVPTVPVSREIEKATWKEYLLTGGTRREPIMDFVRESWNRCLAMGVDPALGKCFDIRPEKDLGTEHWLLKGLVEDTSKEIYRLIKGKGLLITICDRHGYLVNMGGDYRALLSADKLNFGPGANWSEKSVGTNAIGTALATAQPIRVTGREHFCESHHGWVCSAAPIFDLNGDLIGCIDISGPKSADHLHTMALAIEGARTIENRLFRMQSVNLMSTAFNAVATGLVYIDLSGRIRSANPIAAILMGEAADGLVGADAETWFDLKAIMEQISCDYQSRSNGGFRIRCHRNSAYDTRALPILSPNHTLAGILVVIHELQTVRSPEPATPSETEDAFKAIIGNSSAIQQAVKIARRVAPTPSTVLITGPSGTGKELMAQALHHASPRRNRSFVAVNCGAIPPELIQSELFGYVEGAFTGACRSGRTGKFEQASGGTLFLDEIAEMPLAMQVNLLRVLDEKKITRIGGKNPIPVDVRIMAATNQDLDAMVTQGKFRQDLFFRLSVVRIPLPPLNRRGKDVELLAGSFITTIAREFGRKIRCVDPRFYQSLAAYEWPGNIRELSHAIESAIIMMDADVLQWEHLPEQIRGVDRPSTVAAHSNFNLEAMQKETIHRAYLNFQGNISKMSKALGIGRNTLYAKLKKFDLI